MPSYIMMNNQRNNGDLQNLKKRSDKGKLQKNSKRLELNTNKDEEESNKILELVSEDENGVLARGRGHDAISCKKEQNGTEKNGNHTSARNGAEISCNSNSVSNGNGSLSTMNGSSANNPSKQISFKTFILEYFVWWHEPEYFHVRERQRPKKAASAEEASSDSCHHQTDSLFSSSSGFNNYRGLLNLCIVLLVVSNARVGLENIIKYGILINPLQWVAIFLHKPYSWPNLSLSFCLVFFAVVALIVETFLSKDYISETFGKIIHTVNLAIQLIFPAAVILYVHPNPIFSCVCLGQSTIVFLKLVSYICVNKWCRDASREQKKKPHRSRYKSISHEYPETLINGDGTKLKSDETLSTTALVQYPDNLNVKDLAYFMVAPTLCYELNFPRSARIRKRFLLKRVLEMVFLSQLMMGLIQQWMIPAVNNSLHPFHNSEWSVTLERLLKLAIPNHLIWLIFFYWFFHSCLNVIAELTRFGDREFYKDWWNAETVNSFWSTWNIPVHRWARRHLYLPMLQAKYSKMSGSVAVFFVSAFFHEYLVSVPLRMPRIWAFSSMLGQVPFAMVVSKFLHGKSGNMAVWISIILGQPLAILMYAHDYYLNHYLQPESV